MSNQIHYLDPREIGFIVRRARELNKFEELKASIKERGIIQPLEVRDVSNLPESERTENGRVYKYRANWGEGRVTAALELGLDSVPCVFSEDKAELAVGKFLSENLMREQIPWLQKARLMKSDFDAGKKVEEIAKDYSVSVAHVKKVATVLGRASENIAETDIEALTLDETYTLTTLPAKDQEIVLSVMKDEDIPASQVAHLVKKARDVAKGGKLSPMALKASLKRTVDDLDKLRGVMKLKRLHHSLGPANLRMLLEDDDFKAALDKKKVNYLPFLSA